MPTPAGCPYSPLVRGCRFGLMGSGWDDLTNPARSAAKLCRNFLARVTFGSGACSELPQARNYLPRGLSPHAGAISATTFPPGPKGPEEQKLFRRNGPTL